MKEQHSLIEFKLAKSTSLKRNLQRQLPIYQEANETRTSVTVVISYTDTDTKKAQKILTELGLASIFRGSAVFGRDGGGALVRV